MRCKCGCGAIQDSIQSYKMGSVFLGICARNTGKYNICYSYTLH